MFNFAWPWVFLLLPAVFLLRLLKPVKLFSLTFINAPIFSSDLAGDDNASRKTRWWWHLPLWLLLITALARPEWVGEPVSLPVQGRDITLAIDISGSMAEEDMIINRQRVNRLDAVKVVAGEFIEKRQGDRIGLILFGENAYVQAPLTFDRKTVVTLLNESFIGLAGRYTAIGDAIGLALKKMIEDKQSERVLILLTDGENTAGAVTPLEAAKLAKTQGMKIYTIGIGGNRRGLFFNAGSGIDEKTLTTIANDTGGKYFRASNTQELNEIYNIIDQLEPKGEDQQSFRPTTSLFYYPLLGFLALLMLSLWTRRL